MNYICFSGTTPVSTGSMPDNLPLPDNGCQCNLDCILAFPNVTLNNGTVQTAFTISGTFGTEIQ